MARIKIPFRGQTANKMQDGDCRTIVNLRPSRQGVYQPVALRREMRKLTRKYNHMFVHKGSTYEHWIGIQSNKVYVDVEKSNEIMFQTSEPINSIEQVGNVVVLLCNSMTNYLLRTDGDYMFLGNLPELPAFSISIQDTISKSITLKAGDGMDDDNSADGSEAIREQRAKTLLRAKHTLYKTQELIANGGVDGEGTSHQAKGEYLYDAHILRYAYRLYDGTITKHSPPILLMPASEITMIKRMIRQKSAPTLVHTEGYRPTLSADAWYNASWKHIIKSVDIYISPALNMSSIENIITVDEYLWEYIDHNEIVRLIKQDKARDLKSVEECGTLYLLKQIPYENGNRSVDITLLSAKEDADAIRNVQYNELMTVDTGSNHLVGAQNSYVYNNRIHLANIKTTMYKGHNLRYFAYTSTYNNSGTVVGFDWNINVEVTLRIDGKEETVISKYKHQNPNTTFNITSMISYPDPRAVRMKIVGYVNFESQTSRIIFCDVPLTEHKYMNISYYLESTFKPIGHNYKIINNSEPPSSERQVTIYEKNKLKVSAINNPFVYPNANTYQIGNDKILALASQAQKISEGSFGQYPLYIFTTTGIYSLQIGQGEVLYSNQVAPVSYETPVSDIVAETPYGIIFISNRGLCSISGQQVTLISASIDQLHDYINIHDSDIVEKGWPDLEFEEYLANVKSIIYNPYHDEIIIISSDSDYSYVYNIATQSFWLSTEDTLVSVRNTFPELYVIGSNALKTMKESREKSVRVAIITHPINFGTPDIKKMDRAMLRSLLLQTNVGEINAPTPKKMLIGVYNSLDEVNFNLSRGVMLQQDGGYKNIDLGLMARTKSRHFIVAIAGTINEGSKIENIEFEVVEEYNNEKMR